MASVKTYNHKLGKRSSSYYNSGFVKAVKNDRHNAKKSNRRNDRESLRLIKEGRRDAGATTLS